VCFSWFIGTVFYRLASFKGYFPKKGQIVGSSVMMKVQGHFMIPSHARCLDTQNPQKVYVVTAGILELLTDLFSLKAKQ